MLRYALFVLLLGVTFLVNARDVRMHGANGDGGACPEAAADASVGSANAVRHVPPAVNRGKAKAPTLFRPGGDEDNGPHAPRWHSFLPGMFR